jgi:hypothetical protein
MQGEAYLNIMLIKSEVLHFRRLTIGQMYKRFWRVAVVLSIDVELA